MIYLGIQRKTVDQMWQKQIPFLRKINLERHWMHIYLFQLSSSGLGDHLHRRFFLRMKSECLSSFLPQPSKYAATFCRKLPQFVTTLTANVSQALQTYLQVRLRKSKTLSTDSEPQMLRVFVNWNKSKLWNI